MTLLCRTVLDLRSPLDKYITQTLLLAASWHHFCAGSSRLEVKTVGSGSALLSGFFSDLGIDHEVIPPGQNDDFSKSSNKIEAAYADPAGARVLLLDNDVCFLGGLSELDSLPAAAIAASEAGTLRISEAQWALISDELRLPTLRRRYIPVNQRSMLRHDQSAEGFARAAREHHLYLNSGVVLLPAGHDHRSVWKTHQRRVYEFFRAHPLGGDSVTSSDQAGFATSVAEHGEFAWLPVRFNYRRGCFHVGMETPDRIGIVHMTGDVSHDAELGVADRVIAYWQQYVLSGMARIPVDVGIEEKRRRHDIAISVRETLLSIAREYDLDGWLISHRKSRLTQLS